VTTIAVREARASASDKRWMAGVYRDYLDDLSPGNTGLFPMLDEVGHSEPDQLERWFADPTSTPLVIVRGAAPVGFAMVARGGVVGRSAVDYRMAEFFVARAERGRGVGRSAVPIILDRFAGRWEICEFQRNAAAVRFWRTVVARYTGGDYTERIANGEVRQLFRSGPRRPQR
jgi:predicted acetyltransferase